MLQEEKVYNKISLLEKENQDLKKELESIKSTFDAISEYARDFIIRFDRDLCFVYVNKAINLTFDLPDGYLIGKKIDELKLPGKYKMMYNEALEKIFHTGEPENFEFSMPYRDKKLFFSATVVPEKGKENHFDHVLAILRDVTSQRQSTQEREQLLKENQESRKFMNTLIDSLPVSIALLSGKDHVYTLQNKYSREIFKGKGATALGRPLFEVYPELKDALKDPLDKAYYEKYKFHTDDQPIFFETGEGVNKNYLSISFIPINGHGKGGEVLSVAQDTTKLVNARIKAEEESARSKAILSSITNAITIMNPDGFIDYMNETALKLNLVDTPDIQRHISDFESVWKVKDSSGRELPPSQWPFTRALKEPFSGMEVEIVWQKTEYNRFCNYSGTPVYDKNGKMICAITICQDVSEQILAHHKLEETALRDEAILTNMTDGLMIHEKDGRLSYLNPTAKLLHDIPPCAEKDLEKIISFTLRDLNDNQLNIQDWPFSKALRHEKFIGYEVKVKNDHSGREWIASYNGSPVFNGVGNLIFVVITVNDITEQKISEKIIHDREEQFRHMFELHNAVMLLIEPESGKIMDANLAATAFYGYSKKELQAKRIEDLNKLKPEEIKSHRKRSLEKNGHYFVFPHVLSNGQVRQVEVHSSPVEVKGKKLLFSIIHDITDRSRLQEVIKNSNEQLRITNEHLSNSNLRLSKINNLLENMLYITAHDLRSPIANMKLAINVINRAVNLDQKLFVINSFPELVNQMDRTIFGLSEVLQVEKDKKQTIRNLQVKNLVEQLEVENRDTIINKNALVSKHLDNIYICYIETFLYSILKNLLGNALKYGKDDEPLHINISGYKLEHFTLIKFCDNGIGIDLEKNKGSLFTPFKRLTKKGEGTGVGLYIVKSIIEKNGGYIEVESQPGMGTTFYCYLKPYDPC